MAQLLVRDIESAVVKKLRSRALHEGISVEEAHRRVLRTALLGDKPGAEQNILEYLRSIPQGPALRFPRDSSPPRPVSL